MQKYPKVETRTEVPTKNKAVHEVQQDEEPYTRECKDSGRKSDLVNIRYLNVHIVKSVIFTKLELSTS